MLKLASNANFIDGDGRLIEWRYFVNLHNDQIEEGLKFAIKLSSSHKSNIFTYVTPGRHLLCN